MLWAIKFDIKYQMDIIIYFLQQQDEHRRTALRYVFKYLERIVVVGGQTHQECSKNKQKHVAKVFVGHAFLKTKFVCVLKMPSPLMNLFNMHI